MLFDENVSWYIDHNIQTFTADPKGVNKFEFAPVRWLGQLLRLGSGFAVANAKFSINGYIYGTMPMMTMKKGERVRWYLVALGEQFSVHYSPLARQRRAAGREANRRRELMQAQMLTVDMVPDNPGTWMFHCHIDDHMDAGMSAMYRVEP